MPTIQYGLPASYYVLGDLRRYFDEEREHERRLELIAAQQAPVRERQRQAAIQRLSQRMMAPAAYGEMQGGEFAPSFLETMLSAGQGRLGDLYGQQRQFEMQMARDAAYQERMRERQLEVARQEFLDGMKKLGYEPVPSARSIQEKYDKVSAILKNEGNLSPQQMEMALERVRNEPLDMTLRRKPPDFQQIRAQSTEELPDGSMLGLSRNQEVREVQKPYLSGKEYADLYRSFQDELRDENGVLPANSHERIVNTIGQIVAGMRAQRSGQMPEIPSEAAQEALQESAAPALPSAPQGPGWVDRAKIMAALSMAPFQGGGGQQAPGQPVQQQQPPVPQTPVQQIAMQLTDLSEAHGEKVSDWPEEVRKRGKALAQRFQAEIQAQYGAAENVPADLLPVLQLVAKLL